MAYTFCEACGLRIEAAGKCVECGGDKQDASEYPEQPETDTGAVAPRKGKRDKR